MGVCPSLSSPHMSRVELDAHDKCLYVRATSVEVVDTGSD